MKRIASRPVKANLKNSLKNDSAALSVYSDYTDEREEKIKMKNGNYNFLQISLINKTEIKNYYRNKQQSSPMDP